MKKGFSATTEGIEPDRIHLDFIISKLQMLDVTNDTAVNMGIEEGKWRIHLAGFVPAMHLRLA